MVYTTILADEFSSVRNYSNRAVFYGKGQLTSGLTLDNYLSHFAPETIYTLFPNQANPDLRNTPFDDSFRCWILDNYHAFTFERMCDLLNLQGSPVTFDNVKAHTTYFANGFDSNRAERMLLLKAMVDNSATFVCYDMILLLAALHGRKNWIEVQKYIYRQTNFRFPGCILIDCLIGGNYVLRSDFSNINPADSTLLCSDNVASQIINEFITTYFQPNVNQSGNELLQKIFSVSDANISPFTVANQWLNSYCNGDRWVQDNNWCQNWLKTVPSNSGIQSAQQFCQQHDSNSGLYKNLCSCMMSSTFYERIKNDIIQEFPILGNLAYWSPKCNLVSCSTSDFVNIAPASKNNICSEQQLCFVSVELDVNGEVNIGKSNIAQAATCNLNNPPISQPPASTPPESAPTEETKNSPGGTTTPSDFFSDKNNILIVGGAVIVVIFLLIIIVIFSD